MKRGLIFGFVIVLLALNLAIGAGIFFTSSHVTSQRDSEARNIEIFDQVLKQVRAEYVDGTNLTYQSLVETALKGMVNSLDPHSEFMDEDDYQQLQDDTEGQFGGLGVVVEMKDGYVTVIAPMDDSPGFRAGVLPGDRIVKIDGKDIGPMPLGDVVKRLRGKPDTQVTITVQRAATGQEKSFTLTRAIIRMDMVKDINGKKDFPLGPDKIGYVRIVEFGDGTGDELEAALQKLKAQGVKALVLDLRWNPGGLLNEAVNVGQQFLPRGQLIVSTEGRDPQQDATYKAEGNGDELDNAPMVILVNVGTASAAEIVTGCLQDLHRAAVLGQRTFGKGVVQSIFPLENGWALKLTTAKYYTPSHRVIESQGISPDVFAPITDEEEAALLIKRSPGGLESLSTTNRLQVEKIQDTQLERADDMLKSILLYGNMTGQGNVAKQ
ncbi:MAG TPA: S41 family peptidase [Verrucomicrobiae bacterium]|jgi:carboxyl-terminal processing protease